MLLAALLGCGEAAPRAATKPQPATGVVKTSDSPSLQADQVAEAQRRAEAEQKPLLLFFTAEWSSYCRQMRDDVFHRPEFADAAERFVVAEVDGAKHAELCAKYRVSAYPTLVLAAPDGTALDRIVGLSDAATIIVKMNAALTTFIALRPEAAKPETTTVR
jgi:thioredoxin-related protein